MKFSQILYKAFIALFAIGIVSLQACRNVDNTDIQHDIDVFEKINSYLDWEEQNGFSGIVKIKIKDQPLFTRSFGYANFEEKIPITENTVFDIGSLTKQFTAAAILKLEMQGKLKVEDTLDKFFPWIPEDKAPISLHQLLTHTSGLKKSTGYDYKRSSKKEFLDHLFSSKLESLPGSRYNYSHAAYSVLGAVIEKVSGTSYEEYLHDNLFIPAGMNHTGYVIPRWEENQIAHGYRGCRDWGKPMDLPWASDGPYWNLKANAGLISSSKDIMTWMESIEDSQILSDEARDKFFFPHVREGDSANSFYSYGWVILKSSRDTDVIAHDGNNRRFYTDLYRYKNEDVTILLQSNLDKPGHKNITVELARIIFWPEYEAQVRGSVQICLDSLPENKIGEVAGDFLATLKSEIPLKDTSAFSLLFSDYLLNKHSNEHILEVLNDLQNYLAEPVISKVIITDYMTMEINLKSGSGEDRKNLFVRMIFDEEDLKIRMLIYNRRPY